ncbi:fumarylacetoacetate hydrolase family protein [Virgisporangium aurantiacum]|nr:fumarylacetoacetate hydrolase family protein [Virgisporangium aurantiacum]
MRTDDGVDVGIRVGPGVVRLSTINAVLNRDLGPDLLGVVVGGQLDAIRSALREPAVLRTAAPLGDGCFTAPYRNPPKLWGVGLNFSGHAVDLDVAQPAGMPGSYLRPSSTVIGDGDTILLPRQSARVTAEAELGVVIGEDCRDVPPGDAGSVIFGYTTVLDMTAEDVIRANPRFIPWAKAFDTFCSLGPWVVTPDEIPDLAAVRIATIVNGRTVASGPVSAMMRDPHWLVSYFSGGMALEAGSVIATGTPGAGVIRDGDRVEADVQGVGRLRNVVRAGPGSALD